MYHSVFAASPNFVGGNTTIRNRWTAYRDESRIQASRQKKEIRRLFELSRIKNTETEGQMAEIVLLSAFFSCYLPACFSVSCF